MELKKIQPSQLYINSEKLKKIMNNIKTPSPESIEPIPIKKL
jgi:hypothetical protein